LKIAFEKYPYCQTNPDEVAAVRGAAEEKMLSWLYQRVAARKDKQGQAQLAASFMGPQYQRPQNLHGSDKDKPCPSTIRHGLTLLREIIQATFKTNAHFYPILSAFLNQNQTDRDLMIPSTVRFELTSVESFQASLSTRLHFESF
jgi:hypothetical protein